MRSLIAALLLVGVAWNLLALGSGDLPLYLKRIWRNRDRLAIDRSAALFLGGAGASYVQFLRESLPAEAKVMLAPGYPTGHEGIMEYFLLPRDVHECNAPYEQCARMHAGAGTYVLATRGFSLTQPETLGYQWVPFSGANWEFQGYYAPVGQARTPQPLEQAAPLDRLLEVGLGIGLALVLGFIGAGVASGLVGREHPAMTLAVAFPFGTGLVTFSLFLLSWAGIGLSAGLLSAVLAAWTAGILIAWRGSVAQWARAAAATLRPGRLRRSPAQMTLVIGLLALLGLSLLLAVGLSFYEDDELAIWSTKGYGIVLEGTVWAGEDWGAHGLSYPLNIPLAIGLHRLIAGDQVPISKWIFPIFYASLLLGAWDFLRRHGARDWPALLGVMLLGSVPLLHFHSTLGLANLPLTAYLVLGSLLAVDALTDGSDARVLLSGALLALAAWTRAEALLYAGTLLACFLVIDRATRRSNWPRLVRWVLPLVGVAGAWLAFALPSVLSSHLGSAVQEFGDSLTSRSVGPAPLGTLVAAFAATGLHKERWAAFLPVVAGLALIMLILRRRRPSEHAAEWLLAAGLLLTVEVVSIFFIRSYSRPDFEILVRRAIHRHLMPSFVLLYLAVAAGALKLAWNTRPAREAGKTPGAPPDGRRFPEQSL